jgi:hypothetical protein
MEKILVINNLEISEYNFRATIIISVNENNLWVSEINYGLVINIMKFDKLFGSLCICL